MRKRFGLPVIVILALDWAALDDITTGHQPDFVLEWTFLALSVPLLWMLIGRSPPHDGPGTFPRLFRR